MIQMIKKRKFFIVLIITSFISFFSKKPQKPLQVSDPLALHVEDYRKMNYSTKPSALTKKGLFFFVAKDSLERNADLSADDKSIFDVGMSFGVDDILDIWGDDKPFCDLPPVIEF
jgi:hypothetical protein